MTQPQKLVHGAASQPTPERLIDLLESGFQIKHGKILPIAPFDTRHPVAQGHSCRCHGILPSSAAIACEQNKNNNSLTNCQLTIYWLIFLTPLQRKLFIPCKPHVMFAVNIGL